MKSPVNVAHAEKRAASAQLRAADAVTAFAGSMLFVYIHVVIFALWCGTGLLGVDRYPFQLLTMAVSLEAILLSTFVMIGQNRQASFQQAKAEHDFVAQEQELQANTELTQAVHELVTEIHARVASPG